MSGLRIERVELAPWKRLELLLLAVRKGEAHPPLATDLAECLGGLAEIGTARFAVGIDDAQAAPVSEDDLAEVFEALGEALAEWPAPVSVKVEMFRPGAARAGSDEDGEEDESGRVAVFTLRSQARGAA